MSLQNQLAAASTREHYVAILKVTLVELAKLCHLVYAEGMPEPFRIKFKDQGRLYSRIAELWIHGAAMWIKEPEAKHLSLPISGYVYERRWAHG